MTFNEYQEFVASIKRYPAEYKMLYPTLGLCGEAGEVAEKVKKGHGHAPCNANSV